DGQMGNFGGSAVSKVTTQQLGRGGLSILHERAAHRPRHLYARGQHQPPSSNLSKDDPVGVYYCRYSLFLMLLVGLAVALEATREHPWLNLPVQFEGCLELQQLTWTRHAQNVFTVFMRFPVRRRSLLDHSASHE